MPERGKGSTLFKFILLMKIGISRAKRLPFRGQGCLSRIEEWKHQEDCRDSRLPAYHLLLALFGYWLAFTAVVFMIAG